MWNQAPWSGAATTPNAMSMFDYSGVLFFVQNANQ
jgi:hypothetical protein